MYCSDSSYLMPSTPPPPIMLYRLTHVVEWDRWLLCFLIGILVGLLAALLRQATTALGGIRLDYLKEYARVTRILEYNVLLWS